MVEEAVRVKPEGSTVCQVVGGGLAPPRGAG